VRKCLAFCQRSGRETGHPAHEPEHHLGAAGDGGTYLANRRGKLARPDIGHATLALGYGTFGLVELVSTKRDHGLSSSFHAISSAYW
jgi:hypothetical protein